MYEIEGCSNSKPIFKQQRFDTLIERLGLLEVWPLTVKGHCGTNDDDVLAPMAALHPELQPLRQAKKSINSLALFGARIGTDALNRASVWPFGTVRLTAVLIVECGLGPMLCATHHDAFYLECAEDEADTVSEQLQSCFRNAAEIVLSGRASLRLDTDVVRFPEHYDDQDRKEIWDIVSRFLAEERRSLKSPIIAISSDPVERDVSTLSPIASGEGSVADRAQVGDFGEATTIQEAA